MQSQCVILSALFSVRYSQCLSAEQPGSPNWSMMWENKSEYKILQFLIQLLFISIAIFFFLVKIQAKKGFQNMCLSKHPKKLTCCRKHNFYSKLSLQHLCRGGTSITFLKSLAYPLFSEKIHVRNEENNIILPGFNFPGKALGGPK